MITADDLWPKLEAKGEEEVRRNLAAGIYGEKKTPLVKEWLERKERERAELTDLEREAREDKALRISAEANSIARDSNQIARGSKRAAWAAVAVSVLALIVAFLAVFVK